MSESRTPTHRRDILESDAHHHFLASSRRAYDGYRPKHRAVSPATNRLERDRAIARLELIPQLRRPHPAYRDDAGAVYYTEDHA